MVPQILLAAMVDDENSVVFFQGILTSEEFIEFIPSTLNNKDQLFRKIIKHKHMSIPIGCFKGGINRLLSFVRILKPSAIPKIRF